MRLVPAGPEPGPITRRGLVQGAIVAGAVGAVAAAVPAPADATKAPARIETDADVLRTTLGVEQLVVFVYEHVLAAGALSATARRVVGELRSHEQAHVHALSALLTLLGGAPEPPPVDLMAAGRALATLHVSMTLSRLGTERDCVRLLMAVESVEEGAYLKAISNLGDGGLLQTAAQIMACEAQHATALSRLLHPFDLSRAVPDAFVQGRH